MPGFSSKALSPAAAVVPTYPGINTSAHIDYLAQHRRLVHAPGIYPWPSRDWSTLPVYTPGPRAIGPHLEGELGSGYGRGGRGRNGHASPVRKTGERVEFLGGSNLKLPFECPLDHVVSVEHIFRRSRNHQLPFKVRTNHARARGIYRERGPIVWLPGKKTRKFPSPLWYYCGAAVSLSTRR
eukprot:6085761-Pyramimonas_sp.AAC.1